MYVGSVAAVKRRGHGGYVKTKGCGMEKFVRYCWRTAGREDVAAGHASGRSFGGHKFDEQTKR